jgi:hypothetical protein
MRRDDLPVGTVAAVLAEVVRGRREDAAVFARMRSERVRVSPVDTRTGVRAGQLLGAAGFGSDRAVDAFLIAVADLAGGAMVATVDPADLTALADHGDRVAIVSIQP